MWNELRAREVLVDTIGDVRMDGTMASISGTDSPNILITRSFQKYIEQTGDVSVLMEERTYFDDAGKEATEREHREYRGTILEHLLLLQLVAFYGMLGQEKPSGQSQAEKPSGQKAALRELADCMTCIADWTQSLLEKQGARYQEIAVELNVLLAHREDLLGQNGYGEQILGQYRKAVREERPGGKTRLPARQIIDSLIGKAGWLSDKEDKDE